MSSLNNLPQELLPLSKYNLSNNLFVFLSRLKFKKAILPSNINLPKTYTVKPVVLSKSKLITFPELAIVEIFRSDNWDAYWVDVFHKKVWNKFPEKNLSTQLQ